MLKSLVIDGNDQAAFNETDWFTVDDIEDYPVQIGRLIIKTPAEYLYYDKTNKDDLSLKVRGYVTETLEEILRAANDNDIL